jgi:hypothetical protein
VEEAAIPGEIPFAAAEDQRAIEAGGERRERRCVGERQGETVRGEQACIELDGELRKRLRAGSGERRRGPKSDGCRRKCGQL